MAYARELPGGPRRLHPDGRFARELQHLGYMALGEVIGAAGGERYEDHVRRHILGPLGMSRTDFGYRVDMTGDAATGHQLRVSPMTPLRACWSRGG